MLLELIGQSNPPRNWADLNQSRNIDLLKAPEEVLAAAKNDDMVSKIHSYEADFLRWLRNNGAYLIVTRRNEADILASHYHHFSKEKFFLPARFYAATVGFAKALEVALYDRIATAPGNVDLIVDFRDLKTDPAGTLAEVVSAIGLDFGSIEITAAAKRANMRGRDYNQNFFGMEERSWFFRRDDSALKKGDQRAFERSVRWAHYLLRNRNLELCLIWLFMRDPRRSKFLRYKTGVIRESRLR